MKILIRTARTYLWLIKETEKGSQQYSHYMQQLIKIKAQINKYNETTKTFVLKLVA